MNVVVPVNPCALCQRYKLSTLHGASRGLYVIHGLYTWSRWRACIDSTRQRCIPITWYTKSHENFCASVTVLDSLGVGFTSAFSVFCWLMPGDVLRAPRHQCTFLFVDGLWRGVGSSPRLHTPCIWGSDQRLLCVHGWPNSPDGPCHVCGLAHRRPPLPWPGLCRGGRQGGDPAAEGRSPPCPQPAPCCRVSLCAVRDALGGGGGGAELRAVSCVAGAGGWAARAGPSEPH